MLARAQLRDSFRESLSSNDRLDEPRLLLQETPAFLRPHSSPADRYPRRTTFNWLATIAAGVVMPVAMGIFLGHPVIGAAIGAVALVAMGLVAVGLDALNNAPPF
jgi:hypothetical protein